MDKNVVFIIAHNSCALKAEQTSAASQTSIRLRFDFGDDEQIKGAEF